MGSKQPFSKNLQVGSEQHLQKQYIVGSEQHLQKQYIIEAVRKIIPDYLDDLLNKEWIPSDWIARCHPDLQEGPLTALFEAYLFLSRKLDLASLSNHDIPEDTASCLRCGWCCTCLRPGYVSDSTVSVWRKRGAVVEEFYRPVGRGWSRRHGCWFFGQVRLRICPLLLRNRRDGKVFCTIYHMGSKFRPPACSRYQPNPPSCATAQPMMIA